MVSPSCYCKCNKRYQTYMNVWMHPPIHPSIQILSLLANRYRWTSYGFWRQHVVKFSTYSYNPVAQECIYHCLHSLITKHVEIQMPRFLHTISWYVDIGWVGWGMGGYTMAEIRLFHKNTRQNMSFHWNSRWNRSRDRHYLVVVAPGWQRPFPNTIPVV